MTTPRGDLCDRGESDLHERKFVCVKEKKQVLKAAALLLARGSVEAMIETIRQNDWRSCLTLDEFIDSAGTADLFVFECNWHSRCFFPGIQFIGPIKSCAPRRVFAGTCPGTERRRVGGENLFG